MIARRAGFPLLALAALAATAVLSAQQQPPPSAPAPGPQTGSGFRFKSGVELINVTATVTDATGRFVPNLRQDDFVVYEDDQRQEITHFSADRVPVSLGILLDTSQSMQGEKFEAARNALDQLLADLSSQDDEFFLMQFSSTPNLLQGWTGDRRQVSRALVGIAPRGGTAMYDAIADSVPLMKRARNTKRALVILSDGNDMTSDTPLASVHRIIRESEALVYAVGIDCSGAGTYRRRPDLELQRGPRPMPFPIPGGQRPVWPPMPPQQPPNRGAFNRCNDPVDVQTLRDLTDDTGGRTEIVRDARELNPATASIADELSRQYYLGYPSTAKRDGHWHSIRVELRDGSLRSYRVRARRGYIAS
jgi:Ca-activated chloride channel family protein